MPSPDRASNLASRSLVHERFAPDVGADGEQIERDQPTSASRFWECGFWKSLVVVEPECLAKDDELPVSCL